MNRLGNLLARTQPAATAVQRFVASAPSPAERRAERNRKAGIGILAGMGMLHFAMPGPFDAIIPKWLPGRPRTWTYVSGAWELTSAALLANPRTRKFGAYAAMATFVAVFPANVQMSIDNPPTTPYGIGLAARLPMQVPMVLWARGIAQRADGA